MRLRRAVVALCAVPILAGMAAGGWRLANARCFQLIGDVTCRVATELPLVALTFDDGPTPEGVAAVLPALERYGAKGTFFLIGEAIAEQPEAARRLSAAGHELGNHTYHHRRMLRRWPGTYRDEIARTDALLRQVGERDPTLLRPPYGKRLIGLPLAARTLGYRMVMWDVEEPDVSRGARAYAEAIIRQVRPGSIVLMHPMHGNRRVVAEALPLILRALEARGYRMVTVSELLSRT